MKTSSQWLWQPVVFSLALSVAVSAVHAQEGFLTDVVPYISPTSRGSYVFRQVLSVGDQMPLAGSSTGKYRLPGPIAGLGGYRATLGTKPVIKLLIGDSVVEPVQPIVGGTAFRGSFVSELTLSLDGSVLSGTAAYDSVWNESTYLGPLAKVNNTTPAFDSVNGVKIAGVESGLDRNIAFVATGSGFGDGQGATIAIFDREAHILPKFGRFSTSTHVVQARTDDLSVILPLHLVGPSEDGPQSYLFMFVGSKDTRSYRPALRKNGLDNGRLFVLMSGSGSRRIEAKLANLTCRWVPVPDDVIADPRRLENFSAANPLVVFDGLVGGTFDKTNRNRLFIATQGQVDGNDSSPNVGEDGGRIYQLTLATDPRQNCVLSTFLYPNTRAVLTSPKPFDIRGDFLFLSARAASALTGGSSETGVWSLKISAFGALREGSLDRVPLNFPGFIGESGFVPQIGTGVWNVGGLIDASTLLARSDAFFVTANIDPVLSRPEYPALEVRFGQLLLMFKTDL